MVAPGWHSIETAPEDRFVILYHAGWYAGVTVGLKWHGKWRAPILMWPTYEHDLDRPPYWGEIEPTHWAPLPERGPGSIT